MRVSTAIILIFFFLDTYAQTVNPKQNIFIITTDGFRWQEVFRGADSALLNNPQFVKNPGLINLQYWDKDLDRRREKLMPFFWNVVARQGQLYGNREENNNVNVTNPFKISYSGYSEILTGHTDLKLNPNLPFLNKKTNILEFLNMQQGYQGRVAAFCSWNIFPYILNEKRSQFPVNSGYEILVDDDVSRTDIKLINEVQQTVSDKNQTRHDLLTFASAKEYIENKHPKIAFISFGETDEFAHGDRYDMYLQKANQVDRFISELWYYVQTDAFYKGNTTFIITTDHGRGGKAFNWHTHGLFTKGSGDTWLALLGAGILPEGEMKTAQQIYPRQLPQTIASLLGFQFDSKYASGDPIALPIQKINENQKVP